MPATIYAAFAAPISADRRSRLPSALKNPANTGTMSTICCGRARCAYFAAVRLGLENHPAAIPALRRLVGRMDIVAFGPDRLPAVFDEIGRWPPRMDFADGCAVVLARSYDQAFVLTTDFRDFSTYGVPFASPEGAFHT